MNDEFFERMIRKINFPPPVIIDWLDADFSGDAPRFSPSNDADKTTIVAPAELRIELEIDGDDWAIGAIWMEAHSSWNGAQVFSDYLEGENLEYAKKYVENNCSDHIDNQLLNAAMQID